MLTVWLPVEVIREVKLLAIAKGKRYSSIVEEALQEYLKKEGEK